MVSGKDIRKYQYIFLSLLKKFKASLTHVKSVKRCCCSMRKI